MFRYLFRKPLAKTYRVLYTAGTGHFFLSVEVKANSAYEAARIFDTGYDYRFRRRAVQEVL